MPTTKPRISINLSENEYAELSALAERHNLSMAWIGHKAILNLLKENRGETLQLPLAFGRQPERTLWLDDTGPNHEKKVYSE